MLAAELSTDRGHEYTCPLLTFLLQSRASLAPFDPGGARRAGGGTWYFAKMVAIPQPAGGIVEWLEGGHGTRVAPCVRRSRSRVRNSCTSRMTTVHEQALWLERAHTDRMSMYSHGGFGCGCDSMSCSFYGRQYREPARRSFADQVAVAND